MTFAMMKIVFVSPVLPSSRLRARKAPTLS
jgi:hypothetical protein